MTTCRWIAFAGIEALVIAVLLANTLLRSTPENTATHRTLAGCRTDTRVSQSSEDVASIDGETLRAVIRSELAALAPAAGSTASPAMPPPRDAALDQLRRNDLHRRIADYLRQGEIGQPELETFREHAMLLEARDSDAVLGRLFRAINLGQLRVSPSIPPQFALPELTNDVQ